MAEYDWRKKLFPWMTAPGSVPLQNPTIYPDNPDENRLFWGSDTLPMTKIKYDLRKPGRDVDPYKVMPIANLIGNPLPDSPYDLHGGKYSYLNKPKKPSGSAGSGKWKKVIEQLGKMTGPEPDWSLSAKKMGVPSPWSPTNVAWSPVGADMFGRKKKKGPY